MRPLREWMRDRRVAALLAVLAVVFAGYRIATVRTGRSPAPEEAVRPSAEAAPPEEEVFSAPAAAKANPPRAPVRWSWDRNPFLPAGEDRSAGAGAGRAGLPGAGDGGGDLADLKGTVVVGGAGMAIFGTRVVPAGEKTGEWRVDRVKPYGVTVRRGNEVREVEMFKPPPGGSGRTGGTR